LRRRGGDNQIQSEFFRIFKKVIDFFNSLEKNHNVEYLLVGGVLTPLYAEARQT